MLCRSISWKSWDFVQKDFMTDCYYVIGGDINDDLIDDLLEVDGLTQPTRRGNILDILLTDFESSLESIQSPLASNDDNRSDHDIPVITCRFPPRSLRWSTIKRRSFRENRIHSYQSELAQLSWKTMLSGLGVDDQVKLFNKQIQELSYKFFPMVTYRVRSGENLWFSQGLRRMHKKMKRTYKREGNSTSFRELRNEFRKVSYKAKTSFYSHTFAELQRTHPKRWHSEIRKLSMNGGKREFSGPPQVPGFVGRTDNEMANHLVSDQFHLED